MPIAELSGRHILIVEDEALIAIDVASAFEDAGAAVSIAATIAEGMRLVETTAFSAAVLDYGFVDGDCDRLCNRLKTQGIPFVFHSGYEHGAISKHNTILISKPADPAMVVVAVVNRLRLQVA